MNILMVCLGNICRSPLAEGIMKAKIEKYNLKCKVDSAGTGAYHTGEKPDRRSQEVAIKHGIDISGQRARQFRREDFDYFDYIFAMDKSNFDTIISVARNSQDIDKVNMILNLSNPGQNLSVPDPYYGGPEGFDLVYSMLDKACEALAAKIKD